MSSTEYTTAIKEIARGDLLARLIFERLRWPLWILPIVVFFSAIGVIGFLVLTDPLSFFLHPSGWLIHQSIISLIVQPLFVAYFLWMPKGFSNCLENLLSYNVVPSSEQEKYQDLVSQAAKVSNSYWISSICVLAAVLAIWVIIIVQPPTNPFWFTNQNRLFWWATEIPRSFLASYAACAVFLRVLLFQRLLFNIYSKIGLNLQPLHPDGAGGFSPISGFIVSYIYWFFLSAIFVMSSVILEIYRTGVVPLHLTIQYIMLPFGTIFIIWFFLRSTHKIMLKYYVEELQKYNVEFEAVRMQVPAEDPETLGEQVNLLMSLIETHDLMRKTYPTWPFNRFIWRRVGTALTVSLIPLAAALLEAIISSTFSR